MNRFAIAMLPALLAAGLHAGVIKPEKVTGSSFVVFNTKVEQHNPELTADGKTGNDHSYWASDFRNKVKPPHTIEFDFGKPVTFGAIKLDMVERYNFSALMNNFKIEYFDGKQYLPLVEQKSYSSSFFSAMKKKDARTLYTAQIPDAHPVFSFAPVTGSRVRLTVYDYLGRLDEMSVQDKAPVKKAKKQVPIDAADPVKRYSFAPDGAELAAGFQSGKIAGKAKVYLADRNNPDDVRRYFAAGFGKGTISIPVATPGWYDVFIMSGDQFADAPGAKFTVNDKTVEIPGEPVGNFPWKTVTVKADKEIRINLDGKWIVNTVMVAPLADRKAFDQAVTQTVIGKIFPRCQADPQPTHTEKPEVSALDLKRGFLPFMPSLQQRIFSTTTPRADQRKTELVGAAGTDSVKALSIAFRALRDIPDFKVEYQGKLKATLHPIRNWVQRTGHKAHFRTYATMPELLEENEAKFLPADSTLQYYLRIDVPAGTKPGEYSGSLKITGDGIAQMDIPVKFTVLPFQLEKIDSRQYAAMYVADPRHPFMTEKSDPELDRVRLLDMRKYNMNSILYPDTRYPGKEAFEKHYLAVNKMLDECGYPRFPMAYHNQHITVPQVKEIQEIVKRTGQREILYYPVDEPHFGRRHIAEKIYPEIKTVPGTRTYSTVSQQDVDSFGKALDFRTYMITGYAKFEPDRIAKDCARDKAHFWWYSNSAREYPAANRYKAGFFAYRCNGTGQLYWAYDNAQNDAWNDFDSGSNDHTAIHVIGGKIHSTIQWEAIREGLDDLRYLYLLEKRIAAKPDTPAAREAVALLEKIKKETVIDLKEFKKRFGQDIDVHRACFWAPEKFDTYRNQIIEAIEKLGKLQ